MLMFDIYLFFLDFPLTSNGMTDFFKNSIPYYRKITLVLINVFEINAT